jgi:hypothetical protein
MLYTVPSNGPCQTNSTGTTRPSRNSTSSPTRKSHESTQRPGVVAPLGIEARCSSQGRDANASPRTTQYGCR